MRVHKSLLLVSSLFASFVYATTFQMDVLHVPTKAEMSSQLIQMKLPAKDGFSPNVNVQIQAYKGTIQEYKALSLSQFEQLGLTVFSADVVDNMISFEYAGSMMGFNLHWYARAFKKGDHIYLVTATGAEQEWEKEKQKLISNVNSFELK